MKTFCPKCDMWIVNADDPTQKCPVDGCPLPSTLATGIEYEIKKMSLALGDVLVLKVDAHLTQEMAEHIKRSAETCIPDGIKCMVLGRGMELSILTRDDPLGLSRQ